MRGFLHTTGQFQAGHEDHVVFIPFLNFLEHVDHNIISTA